MSGDGVLVAAANRHRLVRRREAFDREVRQAGPERRDEKLNAALRGQIRRSDP